MHEPIDSPSRILNKEKEAKGAFPMTMGYPKSRNDRTMEWGNGGKTPHILNEGMTKITRNPKRRNDGKSLEILNDGSIIIKPFRLREKRRTINQNRKLN